MFDIIFFNEGAPENCRFQCTVTCTLRAARSAVPVCNSFGNSIYVNCLALRARPFQIKINFNFNLICINGLALRARPCYKLALRAQPRSDTPRCTCRCQFHFPSFFSGQTATLTCSSDYRLTSHGLYTLVNKRVTRIMCNTMVGPIVDPLLR